MTQQNCLCDFCSLKREYRRYYTNFLEYGADPDQIRKMIKDDEKRLVCIKNRPRVRLHVNPNSVYPQVKGAVK